MTASAPGKVIAFYSFKGGTGRTMALANVGCALAQEPALDRPVLLIDWDLEAPGLHRYFRRQLFNSFRGDEARQDQAPGLIDLFLELQRHIDHDSKLATDQDPDAVAMHLEEFPFESYIIETDIPRLHLLKAGRFDRDYATNISAFHWPELYRRSPYLLRGFADRLARDYSFVIINSRTGLTDTSGICAMLMPEILVTVFTPNRQNLSGVIDLVREAARYRSESDDLRPLVVYPLPSRIEASEPGLRQSWRFGDRSAGVPGFQGAFEEAFKEIYGLPACELGSYFDDVQIQHVPRYAYGEEVAILVEETRDRFSLTRSYQRFTARLLKGEAPWEGTVLPEESFIDQALSDNAVEDASRRLASDAYLKLVEEPLTRQEAHARNDREISNWLAAIGAIMGAATAILPLIGERFAPYSAVLAIPVFISLFTSRLVLARSVKTAFTVSECKRELADYGQRRPPYDSETALQRLKERVDPLLSAKPAPRENNAKKRIFISYRRSDTADVAVRLLDWLSHRGGEIEVSLDMTDIAPGDDFIELFRQHVALADVVLVLIGPNWTGSLAGRRRLDDQSDFVRTEVAMALAANKRVIPVLVNGAHMPSASQLPEEIRPLGGRNPASLNLSSWSADVERLYAAIQRTN